jgi:hypothetical protein
MTTCAGALPAMKPAAIVDVEPEASASVIVMAANHHLSNLQ